VVLAQLKRGLEERAVPVPTLSDLRESGGIEQAADTIALLHRQTRQDFGDISELVWFIGKSRHGRVVQFPTRFDGEFSRVLDREVVR
jgi:replicative DNA helicase